MDWGWERPRPERGFDSPAKPWFRLQAEVPTNSGTLRRKCDGDFWLLGSASRGRAQAQWARRRVASSLSRGDAKRRA